MAREQVLERMIEENEGLEVLERLYKTFARNEISSAGIDAEQVVSEFMARTLDPLLREESQANVELSEQEQAQATDAMIFNFSMLLYHELKYGGTQQVEHPVVIVVDPKVEFVSLNDYSEMKANYRNIVGYLEENTTPTAHVPADVAAHGGVAVTGITLDEVTYESGDEVVIFGRAAGGRYEGKAEVVFAPDVYARVQAYEAREENEFMNEYYRREAQQRIEVGGIRFVSLGDVADSKQITGDDLVNEGLMGVALQRMEKLFFEAGRELIQEDEGRMVVEFVRTLNAPFFTGQDEASAVIYRWIPRLFDVQKDKQPNVLIAYLDRIEDQRGLEERQRVENEILSNYQGMAFYFYVDEIDGSKPFFEFGLRQLRALFKAYLEANNKRLGISFPNVRNDEVVSVEDMILMIEEAKQQVIDAALVQEEEQRVAALESAQSEFAAAEEEINAPIIAGEIELIQTRYRRARNNLEDAQIALRDLRINKDQKVDDLAQELNEVKIGFYIETVEAIKHLDVFTDNSDFLLIGTNDMTVSLFKEDVPDIDRFTHPEYFNTLQPRMLEIIWIIAMAASSKRKPVIISGDWGSSPRMAMYAMAINLRYRAQEAQVYMAPSVILAAKQRTQMKFVEPLRLTNRDAVRDEDKGVFDSVFEQLSAQYQELLSFEAEEAGQPSEGYKAVLRDIHPSINASKAYQTEIEEKIDQIKNELREEVRGRNHGNNNNVNLNVIALVASVIGAFDLKLALIAAATLIAVVYLGHKIIDAIRAPPSSKVSAKGIIETIVNKLRPLRASSQALTVAGILRTKAAAAKKLLRLPYNPIVRGQIGGERNLRTAVLLSLAAIAAATIVFALPAISVATQAAGIGIIGGYSRGSNEPVKLRRKQGASDHLVLFNNIEGEETFAHLAITLLKSREEEELESTEEESLK